MSRKETSLRAWQRQAGSRRLSCHPVFSGFRLGCCLWPWDRKAQHRYPESGQSHTAIGTQHAQGPVLRDALFLHSPLPVWQEDEHGDEARGGRGGGRWPAAWVWAPGGQQVAGKRDGPPALPRASPASRRLRHGAENAHETLQQHTPPPARTSNQIFDVKEKDL